MVKDCRDCGVVKSSSEFPKRAGSSDGMYSYCYECQRRHNRDSYHNNKEQRQKSIRKYTLKREYGLTPQDYDRLLKSQNKVCAICQQPCSSGRRLAVDHNHKTGAVRGLLCRKCNNVLGFWKDSAEIAQRAVDYLKALQDELS